MRSLLVINARVGDGQARRRCAVAAAAVGVRVIETDDVGAARRAVHEAARQPLDRLCFAGGDGTLALGLALRAEAWRGRVAPELALLPIGMRNAAVRTAGVAAGVGSAAALQEVLRDAQARVVELPVLDALGLLAPNLGIGLVAAVAARATQVNARLGDGWLSQRIGPRIREAWSAARVAPGWLSQERATFTLTNLGPPAEARGAIALPDDDAIAPGAVLYRGALAQLTVMAEGDRCLVRCEPGVLGWQVPAWLERGLGREGLVFAVSAMQIDLSAPTPVQVAGELVGAPTSFEIRRGADITVRVPRDRGAP